MPRSISGQQPNCHAELFCAVNVLTAVHLHVRSAYASSRALFLHARIAICCTGSQVWVCRSALPEHCKQAAIAEHAARSMPVESGKSQIVRGELAASASSIGGATGRSGSASACTSRMPLWTAVACGSGKREAGGCAAAPPATLRVQP